MNKIEECYVIQRKDGYFYYDCEFIKKYPYEMKPRFTKDINKVFFNHNFWNKFGCEKEIKEMQLQNCKPVKVELRIAFDIEKERKRIDILCNDIKNKFNGYFEKLKNECSTIISEVPELKFRVFEENDIATPFKIEFGEIKVEPMHLRFIRGYKE